MKILFDASVCGLGNNGGSKTIIRSTEKLQAMGHDVLIETCVNNYSYHEPKCKIGTNSVNNWDAVIAVSVWDLDHALEYPGNVFWWMRGWEKWVKGESWLIDQIHNFANKGGKIIVNSSWLVDQLRSLGVGSDVCFSGLDLDFWSMSGISSIMYREVNEPMGVLVHHRHRTKNSDFALKLADKLHKKVVKLDSRAGYNDEQLKKLYSKCKIWFAPTELEGFHNVPAEANLCGCLVVCSRVSSNGMGDYATDDTAMRYDTEDQAIHQLLNPDYSKVEKMQDVLRQKIGNREKNMTRFLELLKG